MSDIINGEMPLTIAGIWIAFGFWGFLGYTLYGRGIWRRWTMRYSVIGCVTMNALLLLIFTAMGRMSIYPGDWDPLSTRLMILCLTGLVVFHGFILVKNWNVPIKRERINDGAILD